MHAEIILVWPDEPTASR